MFGYTFGFQDLLIKTDTLKVGRVEYPLVGATANIDTEAADPGRMTMTRWALIGPFALAAKKGRRKSQTYLTVEGPGWGLIRVGEGDSAVKARAFAVQFRSSVAQAEARAQASATRRADRPAAPAPVRTRNTVGSLSAMEWPE